MYTHILVPVDGSALAEQVLPHVTALARQFGARLTLLQAVAVGAEAAELEAQQAVTFAPAGTVAPPPNPPVEEDEEQTATAYLRALTQRLRSEGLTVDACGVEEPAAEAIVVQARALGADLIAMTTHGRSGLKRLYYGSVAEAVLRHAPCPMLLVRVGGAAAPG